MTNRMSFTKGRQITNAFRRACAVANGTPLCAGERFAKFAAQASCRRALLPRGVESVECEAILEVSYFLFEARVLWSVRCSNSSRAHLRLPPRIFSKGEMKRAQRDAICPSVTMRLGKFSVSADYAGFCSRLHGFRPESRRYERRNSMRACRRASSLIVRPDSILRSSSPRAPQSFFTFLSSSSIKFYSYQFSSCRSSDLR